VSDWWIDTDPTLGSAFSDVDDALAIELVHRRGRLAGLSSVFGNAPLQTTHRHATELAARFGVPVARGAEGPEDVDVEAVDALAAHEGPVLALGPCTNVAAALRRGARWPSLVVLGGTDRALPNARPLHTTEMLCWMSRVMRPTPPSREGLRAQAPTWSRSGTWPKR
jgi:inosine-uridine nucleoside N-ribohydrolase